MDWARGEIARLEEIRTAAIEHRFAVLLDEGRHTQIVSSVEEAVVESRGETGCVASWRWRCIGQGVGGALRSLARYRKELADELGLEPGPDIRDSRRRFSPRTPSAFRVTGKAPFRGTSSHEVVGEGAFAVVWRATQPALHRQVAVKQIAAHSWPMAL